MKTSLKIIAHIMSYLVLNTKIQSAFLYLVANEDKNEIKDTVKWENVEHYNPCF